MKTCKNCGKEFDGYKSQMYCDECREKRRPKKKEYICIGNTYGKIRVDGMADRKYRSYRCHCLQCGRDFDANGNTILGFRESGCGECRKRKIRKNREEEHRAYKGKRFGDLEVKGFSRYGKLSKNSAYEEPYMICICKICGSETEIPLARLKSGHAKSCAECSGKNLEIGYRLKEIANVDGTLITAIDGRRATNKNSSTGHNGVSWIPKLKKYRAYINFKRKQYSLGCYTKIEDAIAARKKAEKEIYGGFLEWYMETYPEQWEKLQKTNKSPSSDE